MPAVRAVFDGKLQDSQGSLRSNEHLYRASKKFLEDECFYGIDTREENISRTKLNMFLVGDGHTNQFPDNTLTRKFRGVRFDYIITNPPYENGSIKADTGSLSTKRLEIAFLIKIIHLLKVGGHACVIVPDGVLETRLTLH